MTKECIVEIGLSRKYILRLDVTKESRLRLHCVTMECIVEIGLSRKYVVRLDITMIRESIVGIRLTRKNVVYFIGGFVLLGVYIYSKKNALACMKGVFNQ